MLRFARFSQFDGARFWIVLFIVTAIYRTSYDTFNSLTQDSAYVFPASSAHFGMPFAYFWFWIPRNKHNKDSTEALVRKASDWSWGCQRGLGNIYISIGFLSAFRFWKFQLQLHWIFNCDFWIWPLCTFTDRISQTHEDDIFCACSEIKKWLLNW